MSAAVSAPSPFKDDEHGSDGRGGRVDGPAVVTGAAEAAEVPEATAVAEEATEPTFLESLPRHLRSVNARAALTREDLPRRGDSLDDPQLSAVTQRVWDAQKQEARGLAEKYRALADLYEHDGDYEEVAELDSVNTTRAALALRVTGSAAGWQLRDAYQAVHLFPQCLEALASGSLPATWFQKMLRTSRSLSDDSRRKLDIAVASWSPDISPERFFALLKKLIALLEQREDRPDPLACLTRSVALLPSLEPGMGTMQISGPIPEILAQWKQLDESARAIQAAQRTALREGTPIPHDPDGRALETGRALPLAELRFLLLGSAAFDLEGVVVPAGRFRLNVTVPALTLLGASDEPGMLEGTIPLPPSMARSLAGGEGAWYRVLAEPSSGAFLPLPAEKYVPTAEMLEHLRLRNSTCAVPGCSRPTSWASECDHIEECERGNPDAGGLTEIENLHLLCWQHHLDKTNGLLDPTRLPTAPTEPGRTRWSVGRRTPGNGPGGVDVVTAIDDLDTASVQIVDDLTRAWTSFLRGAHAADPATFPEPPGPRGPGRVIPLGRPADHSETPSTPTCDEPPPPSLRHHGSRGGTGTPPDGTEISPSGTRIPPGRTGIPPGRTGIPPGRTGIPPDRTETPPGSTEIPPGPWGDYGPPPF